LDPLFVRQNKREYGTNTADNDHASTGDHNLLDSLESGIDLLIPQGTNRLVRIQSCLSIIHAQISPNMLNFRAILDF